MQRQVSRKVQWQLPRTSVSSFGTTVLATDTTAARAVAIAAEFRELITEIAAVEMATAVSGKPSRQ